MFFRRPQTGGAHTRAGHWRPTRGHDAAAEDRRVRQADCSRFTVETFELRRLLTAFLTVNDATVVEGSAGTTFAQFTVTLHDGGPERVRVNYAAQDDSAASPSDFAATFGTLVFEPGETAKTVAVPVVNDGVPEGVESFEFVLSAPVNAAVAGPRGRGVIADDDANFLTVYTVGVEEPDSGTRDAVFTVTRTGSLAGTVTVNYATDDAGGATAPTDYLSRGGTLTFAPGEAVKTIAVPVVGDVLPEATESLTLRLTAASNSAILRATASAVIADNDASSVALTRTAVAEGTGGATEAVLLVRRFGATGAPSTVNFNTTPGPSSATAPADFETRTDSVTFNPGETEKQIRITIVPDAVQEGDEFFNVNITGATNAEVVTEVARVYIIDDDAAFIGVAGTTVAEGDSGTTTAGFVVSRLGSTAGTSTVQYTTRNATATAGSDFTATSGTLTFAPGEASKTIPVPVTGDGTTEANENFTVLLSDVTNATLLATATTAAGSIANDDAPAAPAFYVDDGVMAEGTSAGGTTAAEFVVRRLGNTSAAATVDYSTPVSASATFPEDYAARAGRLTFAAGETQQRVTVPVVADGNSEDVETFTFRLATPSAGTLVRATATATVVDDDRAILFLEGAVLAEGDGGTNTANVTVRRVGSNAGTSGATFETRPAGATAPADFALTTVPVSFAPGESVETVPVPIVADSVQEASEEFVTLLQAPTGATVVGQSALAWIINDDAVVMVPTGVTVVEGNSGASNAVFTLTRLGDLGSESSVTYSTQNGTAAAPADFASASNLRATFAPGAAATTITVPVVPDNLAEVNETFSLVFPSVVNGSLVGAPAPAVIVDEDASFLIVEHAVVVEGTSAGATEMVFNVRRFGATEAAASVNFATSHQTTQAADFTPRSGTLTFAPGETLRTVVVQVTADSFIETNESFRLTLSNPMFATIPQGFDVAVGTILEDDAPLAVTRVFLNGTTWAAAFRDALDPAEAGPSVYGFSVPGGAAQSMPMPWVGLDQISIRFSADGVTVDQSDLSVRGSTIANYPVTGFNYNPATRTATWTLGRSIENDRVVVELDADAPGGVVDAFGRALDGEWAAGSDTFPSGDFAPGGDLRFRLNVLAADANRDSHVSALDLADIKRRLSRVPNDNVTGPDAYSIFSDLNADARINALDVAAMKQRLGRRLPATPPADLAGLGRVFGETEVLGASDTARALLT